MHPVVALEDEFGDVVGKARRGQELAAAAVAAAIGLDPHDLARIEHCEFTPEEAAVHRLADVLGLAPARLWESACRSYHPAPQDGAHLQIEVKTMRLGSRYATNGYLAICRRTSAGILIDPGADPDRILQTVEAANVQIERVLLTHGHGDHVGALRAVLGLLRVPAFVHEDDRPALGPLAQMVAGRVTTGQPIAWGSQSLTVCHIGGHSPGSVCFVHPEVAFVGDVLFAGSVGGTRNREDYGALIRGVARHVLTLDPKVCVYPGHGPATTVGEERMHNPFFA